MAQHTLGRRIEEMGMALANGEGASQEHPEVKILGKAYPLKAQVAKIGGFSAHGDKHELERIITGSNLNIKKIGIVHGEADQSKAFEQRLQALGYDTFIPALGDRVAF